MVSTLEVSKAKPEEADHVPAGTVSTALPTGARVCSEPRRMAHTTPHVVGHRSVVGPPYGVTTSSGTAATRDAHNSGRFDRTALTSHPGQHRLGRRRHLRRARARLSER